MDTKAMMWVILGLILILGGITSSLRDAKAPSSQAAQPAVSRPTVAETEADKKFDTGFVIDPVKGLQRKDENQEYFK